MLESAGQFLIVAVAPLAIHFYASLGRILPAPIKSGLRTFDAAYNRFPWLPSAACGLFAATALAVQKTSDVAFAALLGVAALFFVIDVLGVAMGMYAYMSRRR